MGRRGARVAQSPSPSVGEGFRVRGFGKVAHRVKFHQKNLSGGSTIFVTREYNGQMQGSIAKRHSEGWSVFYLVYGCPSSSISIWANRF
jgi:hypothetical protein